jgi:hypothetical protein
MVIHRFFVYDLENWKSRGNFEGLKGKVSYERQFLGGLTKHLVKYAKNASPACSDKKENKIFLIYV